MRTARPRAKVVVDLQAIQSPTTRTRGIGGYARNWVRALERFDPTLVTNYVLNPNLAPPGRIDEIVASGKLAYPDDVALGDFDLWHSLSMFDLAVTTGETAPQALFDAGLRFSATVYDLIPALDPTAELADLGARRAYRTRLELVRAADLLLTMSVSVADDLSLLAGVPAARVEVVGGAPDGRFRAAPDPEVARYEAIKAFAHLGLERSYVLATSGSHPRKNSERLIEAFCSLPVDLRSKYQLVITGEMPESTAHHYRTLASRAGAPNAVVPVGHVDDERIVLLTQGAALACAPSLAEGYGLMIVEAQACRVPVVASDRPPFDELVAPEGLFDPTDTASIAQAIARGLEDESLRERLRTAEPDTWEQVAERSAKALRSALARPPRWSQPIRPLRRRRPRVAFVTPLPPAPSGVAGYSYALIEALLATEKVQVDVFAEHRDSSTKVPDGAELYSVEALGHVERLAGSYDEVVYTLGNSHHHLGAIQWLRRRSGVVIAHDVRLSNLYRHEHGDPALRPGGFERALHAMYPGDLPAGLGHDGELSSGDVERYGALMAREAIAASSAYLVSSHAAAGLARADAGGDLAGHIGLLPFAFSAIERDAPGYVEEPRPAPDGLGSPIAESWGLAAPPEGAAVVAHFGIVDPQKRPEFLIDALALLEGPAGDAMLCFVGPIADELAASLAAHAEERGVAERVVITGPLSAVSYRDWLGRADIAVQLRAASNGEASAAIGECLRAGLATVVSDLGWAGELPDGAVVKLAVEAQPADLASLLSILIGDAEARRRLGTSAERFAAEQTFARAARALLVVLERQKPAPLAALRS